MAANQAVQALIQEKVLAVAQAVEDSLDDELHRLDKLTEDDLDGLRRKRIEQMRLAAKRKQQWLERGHGSYIDVTDEKVWVPLLLCPEPTPWRQIKGLTCRARASFRHAGVLRADEGGGAVRVPLLQELQLAMQGAHSPPGSGVRSLSVGTAGCVLCAYAVCARLADEWLCLRGRGAGVGQSKAVPLSRHAADVRVRLLSQVMDRHLETLSKLHLETKFCRIDAEKSPFLTEKLKIWMLPTLALVKHEKVTDYVVGLDELGGRDDFTTEQLRLRLAAGGLVHQPDDSAPAGAAAAPAQPQRALRSRDDGDEDSDFE
jgi:hypothetical protein